MYINHSESFNLTHHKGKGNSIRNLQNLLYFLFALLYSAYRCFVTEYTYINYIVAYIQRYTNL